MYILDPRFADFLVGRKHPGGTKRTKQAGEPFSDEKHNPFRCRTNASIDAKRSDWHSKTRKFVTCMHWYCWGSQSNLAPPEIQWWACTILDSSAPFPILNQTDSISYPTDRLLSGLARFGDLTSHIHTYIYIYIMLWAWSSQLISQKD